MTMETRMFGAVELDETRIVDFVQPLFGFEDRRRFALLSDAELGPHIGCLQSLEEPGLCFVLMDPSALHVPYSPTIPEQAAQLLGAGEYECWVVTVLGDDLAHSTVNLKSPVLVNWKTRRGMQLILDQDYPVRCPLTAGTGAAPC